MRQLALKHMKPLIISVFIAGSLLLSPSSVEGQELKAFSTVDYDQGTNTVIGFSNTTIDAALSYDYSVSVTGLLQEDGVFVAIASCDIIDSTGCDSTSTDMSKSVTIHWIGTPGSNYTELGDHEVIYIYYTITPPDSGQGCFLQTGCTHYFDYYGFSLIAVPPEVYDGVYDQLYSPLQAPVQTESTKSKAATSRSASKGVPVPGLKLTSNDIEIGSGGTAYIGLDQFQNPQFPTLQASLTDNPSSQWNVTWQFNVSYAKSGPTVNCDKYRGSKPWPEVDYVDQPLTASATQSATAPFKITQAMNGAFRGGTATISWKINGKAQGTIQFYIYGISPSKAAAESFLGHYPWFLWKLVAQETSFRMFDPSGAPLFGLPCGFGLMQIDPPPPSNPALLWNWQTNAQAGLVILGDFNDDANWNVQVLAYEAYRSRTGAEPPCDREIGYCTFSYPGDRFGVKKPFSDANWLKRYNTGGSGYFLRWNIGKNVWEDSRYTVYVGNVCSHSEP